MSKDFVSIRKILVSVTDKSGLKEFIRGIKDQIPESEIIASGGTARELEENALPFTPLEEFTGFPECFDGRVKTLHPRIAGGILLRRDKDEQEAKELGIEPIDLVICNLYDFQKTSLKLEQSIPELMESMDIGGSTLIRSACKNFTNVTIAIDPKDYPFILHELRQNNGKISLSTREKLAIKGLNISADYEALLAKVLTKQIGKERTERPRLTRGRTLPYGENPDQQAWVYDFNDLPGIAKSELMAGKNLSYNNYEDATVAYNAAQELLQLNTKYGVSIIKHGSLCAYATGNTIDKAFEMAWEGDSKSAYGSVIAITSRITDELRSGIKNKFVEVLIAPEFDDSFVEWAKEHKKRLRLVKVPNQIKTPLSYKNISGGMLVQTCKESLIPSNFNAFFSPATDRIGVVTKKHPPKEIQGLFAFGVAAVNYAKSNAIAIVREPEPGCYQLIAMGAGQPNRVDSLERLAIPKAIENLQHEHDFDHTYDPKTGLADCVIASDGFFPFDDSIRFAAKSGIRYCIQPGGSKRDDEVIKAADELGMCMVMTGSRYFFH